MKYTEATLPKGITAKEMREFAQADRLMKKYTARREELREKVLAAFPNKKGTYLFEDIIIERGVSMVTDTAKMQEMYPYEQYPQYYKSAFDAKKVPDAVKEDFKSPQPSAGVKTV